VIKFTSQILCKILLHSILAGFVNKLFADLRITQKNLVLKKFFQIQDNCNLPQTLAI